MSLGKFKFKPEHQPDADKPVEFDLKPLDMATFHQTQVSVNHIGDGSWDDYTAIFVRCVTGWSGIDKECTPAIRRQIAAGEVDRDFYCWIKEIGEQLYTRALVRDVERKNS